MLHLQGVTETHCRHGMKNSILSVNIFCSSSCEIFPFIYAISDVGYDIFRTILYNVYKIGVYFNLVEIHWNTRSIGALTL